MKIAVVGSGISGLYSARLLSQKHEVHLFEAADKLGGHTNTEQVQLGQQTFGVNTGFIVYNDRTYPGFIKLMDELGVASQNTRMSFSVRDDGADLEYCGSGLNGLFAQRRNLVRPDFLRMVQDILRFNKQAKEDFASGQLPTDETLNHYLDRHGFGLWFKEKYLVPMGAAIWSSSEKDMGDFPVEFFVRFFLNHGLLDIRNRPQWKTLVNGSEAYIDKIITPYQDRIRLACPVEKIIRDEQGVILYSRAGSEHFDAVVLACHSDQALKLLAKPSPAEQDILGALPYADNEVVLHTDSSHLPKRPLAWSAWNYRIGQAKDQPVVLTYNMNILQNFSNCPETFCVSLNNRERIDPNKVIKTFNYAHPIFSLAGQQAKSRFAEINGQLHTYFCGAYWFNGFHEDGVQSALRACQPLLEPQHG